MSQTKPIQDSTSNPQPDLTSKQLYSNYVLNQRQNVPIIYGNINFTSPPERFTTASDVKTQLSEEFISEKERLLADEEMVMMMRNYTMTGDQTSDAYAALIPEYGFLKINQMLEVAVKSGIDAVDNPPQELREFISEMEAIPEWLDMELIEKGAVQTQIVFAFLAPFTIRGALIATFLNKYTALPMAITGAFSSATSAKRTKETGSFFAATIMPRALERHGDGFLAAAKVRLMHSMVRFNIIRTGKWDDTIYGVPIPQSDQMPAGMLGIYLMAQDVIKSGRTEFTPEERARAELYRYRCFLLGLPESLLETNPQRIIDLWLTRSATLRDEFEDATCGNLIRSTLEADLTNDNSFKGRLHKWMERGFFKMYFVKSFMNNNYNRAAQLGIKTNLNNKIAAIVTLIWIFGNIKLFKVLDKSIFKNRAERFIIKKMQKLLESYGHAEFVTDARRYNA